MALNPPQNKQKQVQEDIKKYTRAMEENPDSRLFAALADALRRAGRVEEALSVAEQGVKKHPKYVSGLVVLGQAYQAKELYEKALGLFQQVVRMNPENVVAQKSLASIYDHMGDHEKALNAYRAITILDPVDQNAVQRLRLLEATAPKKAQPRESEQIKTEGRSEGQEKPDETLETREQEITDPEPVQAEQHSSEPEVPESTPEQQQPGSKKTREQDQNQEEPAKTPPPVHQDSRPLPDMQEEQVQQQEQPQPADQQPKETQTKARPPSDEPAASKLSEEQKLDLFFQGADLEEIGIAEKAGAYQVKSAARAFEETGPQAGTDRIGALKSYLESIKKDKEKET